MNDQEPGSDFIVSAIRRARDERLLRHQIRTGGTPAASVTRGSHWEALTEFTPDTRHLERHLLRTLQASNDAMPFDIIRTKLLRQMRSNNWRRVAFASPDSGCGKSLLTLNLALSMGRQPDLATMAIELDLRRPSMARTLGLKMDQQFSEVLAGRATAADHMVRIGSNLAVATNARAEPAAAELLATKSAAHVIDQLESDFTPDVMLFDLPPLLMTDDAMAFMDQLDCVLLVAAAEQNTVTQITRCANELAAHCNFLGVILNKCRFMPADERYGYGDGYG